ncbi:hypothetical protein PR202_gb24102 [Eleusine coracana subsp. coracana]|uniref:R13L1/DRL21-like LRR repeat region domain-containing protein n=1 Tax=Eleusine coracana subsp. coracana TaxID=191504 RepID=A0AAV5FKK0_ELECO|nr:hypothetical protein PR202_gb24102 [Eleusine coracana subsp. coracana]
MSALSSDFPRASGVTAETATGSPPIRGWSDRRDSTNHARISELENLDKLNGKLNITNIVNVNDPYDAENVHLKNKNGIQKLSLDWYSRGNIQARRKLGESVEESPEVTRTKIGRLLDMEKDLYLLNNLEPPSGIENLRIRGYRGLRLPRWMVKQSGSCDLDDIYMPEQHNPPQFSHLTKLVLENLSNIEYLQGLVDLPGIMVLKLRRMPKLMELLTTRTYLESGEEQMEMQHCFPQLTYFVISDCPKLMVKPYFPPSLQRLTLDRSNEQLLSSCNLFLRHHAHGDEPASSSFKPSHLTELKLKRLIESSLGWDVLRHLTGLQVLEISGCKDLRQLPESMRSLNCLLRLKVTKCGNLCMLPEWLGELRTLESLDIEGTCINEESSMQPCNQVWESMQEKNRGLQKEADKRNLETGARILKDNAIAVHPRKEEETEAETRTTRAITDGSQ